MINNANRKNFILALVFVMLFGGYQLVIHNIRGIESFLTRLKGDQLALEYSTRSKRFGNDVIYKKSQEAVINEIQKHDKGQKVLQDILLGEIDDSKVTGINDQFNVGIYDCNINSYSHEDYPDQNIFSIYADWSDYDYIIDQMAFIWSQYNPDYIVLSLEPFTTASGDADQIFEDTLNTDNDVVLAALNELISLYGRDRTIIRFAHEMELSESYPWSAQEPEIYKQSYRYIHDYISSRGTTTSWMFSPAGNDNATDYYPGDKYVDTIGLTLLSYDGWHKLYGYGGDGKFDTLFEYKYGNVEELNEKIIIIELGIAPPDELKDNSDLMSNYQKAWLDDSWIAKDKYELLNGGVYFNCPNPINSSELQPIWEIKDSSFFWKKNSI